jgi:hypothetical protein
MNRESPPSSAMDKRGDARSCRSAPAYNLDMKRADLRRWVEDRRAVARLEQGLVAETWGPPEQAIAAALSLIALEGRLHGWPPPADPVSEREDQAMWDRFARLRAKFVSR